MLLPILGRLITKDIVLVSASPRRKALLDQIGLCVRTAPSTFAEDLNVQDFPSIADYVKKTAQEKSSLYRRTSGDDSADLIIAADTVVILDNEVIGKPPNKEEAIKTLTRLSGRTHTVITGVALIAFQQATREGELPRYTERVFHNETVVKFGTLTPNMIDLYVNTNEPMGKAGAYAIQGIGASFIEGIEGDYYNVMGFPIHQFCKEIMDMNDKMLL